MKEGVGPSRRIHGRSGNCFESAAKIKLHGFRVLLVYIHFACPGHMNGMMQQTSPDSAPEHFGSDKKHLDFHFAYAEKTGYARAVFACLEKVDGVKIYIYY